MRVATAGGPYGVTYDIIGTAPCIELLEGGVDVCSSLQRFLATSSEFCVVSMIAPARELLEKFDDMGGGTCNPLDDVGREEEGLRG